MKAVGLKCISAGLGLAIATSAGGAAEAATLILGASTQSRYDQYGIDFLAPRPEHPPLANTLTGWRNDVEFRSYFFFDLDTVSTAVTGARLRLLNKRYYSTEASETLQLFDIVTPMEQLVGGFGRPEFFADLGQDDSGQGSYGEVTLVSAPTTTDFDNLVEEYFEVVLTQAAIDGINRAVAAGQRYFGIGIRLADTSRGSPYAFKCEFSNGEPIPPDDCPVRGVLTEGVVFSGGKGDPRQQSEVPGELLLDLQPDSPSVGVPEPATALSLITVGLTGIWFKSRLRQSD
ncbi:PEP-CTERM sorting domain-containing protein [Leptolyngbya iicbica]|uniref:PEP-CTERM sorting domain-containing protein n=2 Tax=Cyanophyceae TaxID=3028117 RepID=A0A4Q7E616_9CYAN|nr:PEP-CTERM sorting domain-containing protein [Leptolyngbya sp. LK]RZM77897.1 PEP-CTERM sorting domain-containing protein [Leptolyngbya sp. LK]